MRLRLWLKWLYPGMGVKRWIFISLFGVLLVSAALALAVGIEVLSIVEGWVVYHVIHLTGSLPPWSLDVAAMGVGVVGVVLIVVGFRCSIRSIIEVLDPASVSQLADIVYAQRHLKKGPNIVVIGGGTGLSVLLRGLKHETSNITAIVAVSDDGGSSGRLRTELGMPPPGDIRNTLLALADTEPLMQQLFDHRFAGAGDLAGHNFGNLLIAALTEVTGDFEAAVRESSRVLAIRGQVVPSTLENVRLRAEYADGSLVQGESRIPQAEKRVQRVYLEPDHVAPTAEACRAIAEADMIVLGPGSLYTSVIPNLLVTDLAQAVRRSNAVKAYVCNVMTQKGETTNYGVVDHVRALHDHAGSGLFEYVIMNNVRLPDEAARQCAAEGSQWIAPQGKQIAAMGLKPIEAALSDPQAPMCHDGTALARLLLGLLAEVTAPLPAVSALKKPPASF